MFGTWVAEPLVLTTDTHDPNLLSRSIDFGQFRVDADPLAPGSTFAYVALNSPVPQVMAVLTPAAVTAALVSSDGTSLVTSAVVDRTAGFIVPDSHSVPVGGAVGPARVPVEGLRVVAYDAAGSPVSTTMLAEPGSVDISTKWGLKGDAWGISAPVGARCIGAPILGERSTRLPLIYVLVRSFHAPRNGRSVDGTGVAFGATTTPLGELPAVSESLSARSRRRETATDAVHECRGAQ